MSNPYNKPPSKETPGGTASVSHYSILGVSCDADEPTIKKAYRKLAMKHHPDKNIGNPNASKKFQEVSHAYEVLSDPSKRRIYDKYGDEGLRHMGGHEKERGMNPADIFSQMFGGMHPFKQRDPFSSRTRPVSRTEANIDLKTLCMGGDISVPFKETVAKNITTGEICTDLELCSECNGTGVAIQTRMVGPGIIQQINCTCDVCEGRGFQVTDASDCIWIDELKEHTTHVFAGQSLIEPLVLAEKGSMYVDTETGLVRKKDLVVKLNCQPTSDGIWQLFSPRHKHLQWTPELKVVYGLLTTRLRCTHPDGNVYTFEMPETGRTDTMIVPGLGLPGTAEEPAGDLFVRVRWDFDTNMLKNTPWFKDMQSGLHSRAEWTDPRNTDEVHGRCLTTEQYEQRHHEYQNNNESSSDSRGHGARSSRSSSSRQERNRDRCGDGRPECVQS